MQKSFRAYQLAILLMEPMLRLATAWQQDLCRVTHGKELCKTYLDLRIGRNYVKHDTNAVTHGENYASPNLHKTLIICD